MHLNADKGVFALEWWASRVVSGPGMPRLSLHRRLCLRTQMHFIGDSWETWSTKKKSWCCDNFKRGCGSYDCPSLHTFQELNAEATTRRMTWTSTGATPRGPTAASRRKLAVQAGREHLNRHAKGCHSSLKEPCPVARLCLLP